MQRVNRGGGANGAGGAQRVTEGNGAAHRVDLGRVQPQRVHHRQRLRGKSLVQLDPVDVVLLESGIAQRRWYCLDGANAHDLRRHTLGGKTHIARQRFQAKLLDCFFAGQDQGPGAVRGLRTVARRDRAACGKRRLELDQTRH